MPVTQTTVKKRVPTAPTSSPTPPAPPAPKSNILDTVSKPGSIEFLRGVLFGPPKTKKTLTAVSGPGQKLLILTEPEGDLVLKGREDVDVIRPTKHSEFDEILGSLHNGEYKRWDTVVFDSVTWMFEILGGKELAKAYQANKNIMRPYGVAGSAINQLISDAVKLPTNVIFTAQIKTEGEGEDEVPLNPEEGRYPLTLAVQPMVYKVLVPAVSFIGRTYKKPGVDRNTNPPSRVVEYWVSFEDFGRSPAGSRIQVPNQVQDLNLGTLLDTIKGE